MAWGQEPEVDGAAEHISAVKQTSPAILAGAIPAVTAEHRRVPSAVLSTLHSLSHLIFLTASEIADTDITLL